jgi:hypothetical protein
MMESGRMAIDMEEEYTQTQMVLSMMESSSMADTMEEE